VFPEFLDFKFYLLQKNASEHTIKGYEYDIQQFYNFVKLPIQKITKQHIMNFIMYLKEELKLTPTTINRKLNALKSFFRYLHSEGIINSNPTKNIPLAKIERKLPQTLKVEDILKVIALSENIRDRLIFEILFATGIRREELVKIKMTDIDFKQGLIKIKGKGKKERFVPVPKHILEHIKEYNQETRSIWLFPGKNDNHLSVFRVNEIFKYYSDKLNIPNLTPHKLRHTFATVMFENGADIRVIQDIMGHASINTTNIYAKTSNKRNIEEYMKFHPLANL